jgi:hypothetical protein
MRTFVMRAASDPIGRRVLLSDLQDNCDLSRIAHPTEVIIGKLRSIVGRSASSRHI